LLDWADKPKQASRSFRFGRGGESEGGESTRLDEASKYRMKDKKNQRLQKPAARWDMTGGGQRDTFPRVKKKGGGGEGAGTFLQTKTGGTEGKDA